MENKKLNGTAVSKILYEELRNYLVKRKFLPSIVSISIGDDFGGHMYAKMEENKINKETSMTFESVHFDTINKKKLINYLDILNRNSEINGITIHLPLPSNLKAYEREILDSIAYQKDVDGLTTIQAGKLSVGTDAFIPCTALGIETLLKAYDIPLEGKRVAIINRSNIVGKPLAALMLRNNATPIICHSKTANLKEVTSSCDIVVAALNKQEYITSDYIKEDAIIIDVGVHKNSEGKTVGDVNYNDVYDKASLITPPTGAVGPMTICMLAYNAAKSVYGEEINSVLEEGIEKSKRLILK